MSITRMTWLKWKPDDPDQLYHDWEKVEKFFIRFAKKYSVCVSKALGGSLGWIHKDMDEASETINQELIDIIMTTEKFKIPEPIKTKLGFHIIMICDSQIHIPQEENQGRRKALYF